MIWLAVIMSLMRFGIGVSLVDFSDDGTQVFLLNGTCQRQSLDVFLDVGSVINKVLVSQLDVPAVSYFVNVREITREDIVTLLKMIFPTVVIRYFSFCSGVKNDLLRDFALRAIRVCR